MNLNLSCSLSLAVAVGLLTASSVAQAQWLSTEEANRTVQLSSAERPFDREARSTTLRDAFIDSVGDRVGPLRRAATFMTQYAGVQLEDGRSPLTLIHTVVRHNHFKVFEVYLSKDGLGARSMEGSTIGMILLSLEGRVEQLSFNKQFATPEFHLTRTEASDPEYMRTWMGGLLSRLGVQLNNPPTEVLKRSDLDPKDIFVLQKEPLAELPYGNGNGVQIELNLKTPSPQGTPETDIFVPRFMALMASRPHVPPSRPILSEPVLKQLAIDTALGKLSGVQAISTRPNIVVLQPIPPDAERDVQWTAPLSEPLALARSQNLDIATFSCLVYVLRQGNRPVIEAWALSFDAQTSELLSMRLQRSNPRFPAGRQAFDSGQSIIINGKEHKLAWRRSFLEPVGEEFWATQGNTLRKVYWNQALKLWMMPNGDHTLVAAAP